MSLSFKSILKGTFFNTDMATQISVDNSPPPPPLGSTIKVRLIEKEEKEKEEEKLSLGQYMRINDSPLLTVSFIR